MVPEDYSRVCTIGQNADFVYSVFMRRNAMQRYDTIKYKNNAKRAEKREYENCVLCGKRTALRKSAHIDLRTNYVEGAGQLCPTCWARVYSYAAGGMA